jgi:hypothetical protein
MLSGHTRIAVLLVGAFIFAGGLSAAVVDDRPVDITPGANVDENLFVLRALAREYNRWPEDPWDGKAALPYCEQARLRVKFLRSIALRHGLDAGVRGMCEDYLTLIEEYESTLARVGEINTNARKKAFEDALNSFVIGAAKGLKAGADADAAGKSELQVDVAVGQGLVDDGLMRYIEHARARDAQTTDLAAAEQSRFGQVLDFAEERNRTTAQQLTERHQWAEGEAGFGRLTAPLSLEDQAARRPRDPFVKLQLAATGIDNKTTADNLMERARLCVEAARLIPAPDAFDGYRQECLAAATTYACDAADSDLGSSLRDAHTPHSQEAINITRTMLNIDPDDRDGWAHVELCRALSAAGRLDEAIAAAQPVVDSPWQRRLAFALRYTRILGATGRTDALEQWLRLSYKLGYADLQFVKESPDFDCLRSQNPAAYAELTTLKGSTYIYFYPFNDDVIVKNRSPFPMTNLQMKFKVIKGGQVWEKERTLEFVAADSEGTVSNVFSIPDSRYDEYRWSLQCDQGKLGSEEN